MARRTESQTHLGYLAGIGAGGALLACALVAFLSLIGAVSVSVWPEPNAPGALAVVELPSSPGASQLSDAEGLIASTSALPPVTSSPDRDVAPAPGGGKDPQGPARPPKGGVTPPDDGTQAPQGGGGQPAQPDQPAPGGGSQQGRAGGGTPGDHDQGHFGEEGEGPGYGDSPADLTEQGDWVEQEIPVEDDDLGGRPWGHDDLDRDLDIEDSLDES